VVDARLSHLVRFPSSSSLLFPSSLPRSPPLPSCSCLSRQAYGLHVAKEFSSSSSSAPVEEEEVSQEEIVEAETAHPDEVEKNQKGEIIDEESVAPVS